MARQPTRCYHANLLKKAQFHQRKVRNRTVYSRKGKDDHEANVQGYARPGPAATRSYSQEEWDD